jgi:O-antigen biosynthesis protein
MTTPRPKSVSTKRLKQTGPLPGDFPPTPSTPADPAGASETKELAATRKQLETQRDEIRALRKGLEEAGQRIGSLAHAASRHVGRTDFARAISILTGRTKLDTQTLIASDQLRPNGAEHGWESLGNDPQFIIPVCTTTRHVHLEFTADIVDRNAGDGGQVQLFFDLGGGFNENDSIATFFTGKTIKVDAFISMRCPAILFRLDPVDRPCNFVIRTLRMTAVNDLTVVLERAGLSLQRLYRNGQLWRQMRHAGSALARGKYMHALGLMFNSAALPGDHYARFVEERSVDATLRTAFEAKAKTFARQPVFSVIMPTYNSPPEFLERAIRSVMAQTYPHWELCIADDGSPKRDTFSPVLDRLSGLDSRIKVRYLDKNGGISRASNTALEMATGDYIALLDHDDEIVPHTLHAYAEAINRDPAADWLYSDEDKIDIGGKRSDPFFKPDWSPAYFLGCMYTCHLGVYRRSMVMDLGGFRPEFDTAQDYDLALRFASNTRNIVHIPDVLYCWRTLPESTASGADAKPIAEIRARNAVQAFIDRGNYPGKAEPGPTRGTHRVKFDIVGNPKVSIAIPSAGYATERDGRKTWFVLELVRSIRDKTTYKNIEIVIADNMDFDPALVEALEPFDVKRVHYTLPTFNMSHKMNLVVEATSGDYVVILNDDMTIINGDWITEMLMWAQQDDVCAVGAKLYFPDGRIQHAGVLMLGQGPSHPYYLHPGSEIGLVCNAVLPHEASVVTGACMMMRRADYRAVDGFDPSFRINYNDVDFCQRLRQKTGKRIVWTPHAELFHYESVSREAAPEGELRAINDRWAAVVGADPYYNRNLSQSSNRYEISPSIRSLADDYGLGNIGKV